MQLTLFLPRADLFVRVGVVTGCASLGVVLLPSLERREHTKLSHWVYIDGQGLHPLHQVLGQVLGHVQHCSLHLTTNQMQLENNNLDVLLELLTQDLFKRGLKIR